MTDSVRETVIQALLAALEGISGVPGLTVHRNLDADVTRFPTLILLDGDEEADEGAFQGICQCRMAVEIEGHVQTSGGSATDIGTAANALYAAVEAAVLADRTVGGTAVDVLKTGFNIVINRAAGMKPQAVFSAAFQVEYWHRSGDPLTPHA